ncbi:MAG: hypothetical protein ACJA02_001069 [Myxococcota bacterium]|jgi:hypothetical protein
MPTELQIGNDPKNRVPLRHKGEPNKSGLSKGLLRMLCNGELDGYITRAIGDNLAYLNVDRMRNDVHSAIEKMIDPETGLPLKPARFDEKIKKLKVLQQVEEIAKDLQFVRKVLGCKNDEKNRNNKAKQFAQFTGGYDDLSEVEKAERVDIFEKSIMSNQFALEGKAKRYFEDGEPDVLWQEMKKFHNKPSKEKAKDVGIELPKLLVTEFANKILFPAATLGTTVKKPEETRSGKSLAKVVRSIMSEVETPNFDARREELRADDNAKMFEDGVYENLLIKKEHEQKLLEHYKRVSKAIEEYNQSTLDEIKKNQDQNAAMNPALAAGMLGLILVFTGAGPVFMFGELSGFSDIFSSDFFALSAPLDVIETDVVVDATVDGIGPLGVVESVAFNPVSQEILTMLSASSTTANAVIAAPLALVVFASQIDEMDRHSKKMARIEDERDRKFGSRSIIGQFFSKGSVVKKLEKDQKDIAKKIYADKLNLDGDVSDMKMMLDFLLHQKGKDKKIDIIKNLFSEDKTPKTILNPEPQKFHQFLLEGNNALETDEDLKKFTTRLYELKDTSGYNDFRGLARIHQKTPIDQSSLDTDAESFADVQQTKKEFQYNNSNKLPSVHPHPSYCEQARKAIWRLTSGSKADPSGGIRV